jgi:hypothetical protein
VQLQQHQHQHLLAAAAAARDRMQQLRQRQQQQQPACWLSTQLVNEDALEDALAGADVPTLCALKGVSLTWRARARRVLCARRCARRVALAAQPGKGDRAGRLRGGRGRAETRGVFGWIGRR